MYTHNGMIILAAGKCLNISNPTWLLLLLVLPPEHLSILGEVGKAPDTRGDISALLCTV